MGNGGIGGNYVCSIGFLDDFYDVIQLIISKVRSDFQENWFGVFQFFFMVFECFQDFKQWFFVL